MALPGQQGHIGPEVNDLNWSCILFKYDSEQEEAKNKISQQSYNYLIMTIMTILTIQTVFQKSQYYPHLSVLTFVPQYDDCIIHVKQCE